MDTKSTKIAITFPKKLVLRLREKASVEYGFDVPEIIRKLAADYLDEPFKDEWVITPEMEERYSKDVEETEKLLREGKIKAAHSLQELREQIESEDDLELV